MPVVSSLICKVRTCTVGRYGGGSFSLQCRFMLEKWPTFVTLFLWVSKVKSLNFSFSSVQLNLDYHISTAQFKSDWQECSFSPEYLSILCLL